MHLYRITEYHVFVLLLALVGTAVFTSCDLINPDEQQPVYMRVDSFTFDPAPTIAEMGPSPSTKIKDVWVFVDGEVQGVYELPAYFPVLAEGTKPVLLAPGIFLNGISTTRSPYPFYRSYNDTLNFIPGGEITVNPSFEYFSSTICKWCEDFEGSGFSLSKGGSSDTSMYQTPYAGDNTVFEGTGSGVVYLDNTKNNFEMISSTEYQLPKTGNPVYLELDYKIEDRMTVGMYVNQPGSVEQFPVITLFPTDVINGERQWNKIYIELGFQVSSYPDATGYKIFFAGIKDPSISGTAAFYLDNIKLVHN